MLYYHLLSPKDKAQLFKAAKKCKICSGQSGSARLVTDHCHTTGIVRGVLCEKCNSWLGVIEGRKRQHLRIKFITKLEKTTGIPAINFLFYLDDFRRAIIDAQFPKKQSPAQKKKSHPNPLYSISL